MLDKKKESAELFETVSLLRKSSYDLMLALKEQLSDDQVAGLFLDLRGLQKKLNEKVDDLKRALEN